MARNNPFFTDTHAHLFLEQFEEDRAEVMQRARDHNVYRIFLPNIGKDTIQPMLQMQVDYPGECYPMMGLHPGSVDDNYEEQLEVVKSWLFDQEEGKRFVAVGEIGLDYYWDTTYKDQQHEALRTQIRWANELNLPIVLHTRDSFDDVFTIVAEEKADHLTGIFHCFTGTKQEAENVINIGFYIGLGGILTFKKSSLGDEIKDVKDDRILIETDAPYLAPPPNRGKRNESSFVRFVGEKLASVKGISVEEAAAMTTENASRLFGVK
ncbi:MAG: hydrolase TatD [Bacteroidetes bacterium SW_11_45_7]|nr:MAG: hydrolase TatD [Bacteroidetes bacterium SW_11_45_7]